MNKMVRLGGPVQMLKLVVKNSPEQALVLTKYTDEIYETNNHPCMPIKVCQMCSAPNGLLVNTKARTVIK